MKIHHSLTGLLLASTLLGGCAMIPDLELPQLYHQTQSWDAVPGYETPENMVQISELSWQQYFETPELQYIIETALENNRDLKQAALSIEEARATYRISRADLLPSINANGNSSITKYTDESSSTGSDYKSEMYEANLGVTSYELDLFGKVRSLKSAALNDYLATEQARAVVRNALIAEVSNAYLQLLTDQKLLSLTEKTLEAQQKTYDLTQKSLELGSSTAQDAARALTAVEVAQVNKHQYTRLVQQDMNALYLLMGATREQVELPKTTLDQIEFPFNLDAGIPSQVLLERPDIRQAEFELLSANADIGAARAAFFPSISLTGTYGYASQDLSNLFSSGAFGAWSFVPQITLPIFKAGTNKANLDLAEIRTNMAIINYEDATQNAFTEVADALVARSTLDQQYKAQRRLVKAAQDVYDKTYARYKAGIDDFLSVLDAQRELYTYQQDEITTQQEYLSNYITLYKTLGGGSYADTKK